jgi:uncharacterized protein (TIGR02391 family)
MLYDSYLPSHSDELLGLPIDVRALRLLELLVAAEDANEAHTWVHAHNLLNPASWTPRNGRVVEGNVHAYLRGVSEAWAWLVGEGLVARRPEQTTQEACFVTARGRDLVTDPDPRRRLLAERRLSIDLHERLEVRVRAQFLLGEVELAAFAAMREVEIRVRELASASESEIGVKLMRSAFKADGPLRRPDRDLGEEDARMNLFAGAIGLFKNPSSHREVDYDDPIVATEIILLADLLLRLLDQQERVAVTAQP